MVEIPSPAVPALPTVPAPPSAAARAEVRPVSGAPVVPVPRRPSERGGTWGEVRWWYEHTLGWPTAPGTPVRLRTGVRFDVLDVPAEAGEGALGRLAPGSPVAVRGDRMLLFVAAGAAEELPGLLDWLEWGALPLDLTAIGAGGLLEAPLPPCPRRGPGGRGVSGGPEDRDGCDGLPVAEEHCFFQGAAWWLRPPEPGCEVEASLPALPAPGGAGNAPDLARLVHTLATRCHRVRISRATRRARTGEGDGCR